LVIIAKICYFCKPVNVLTAAGCSFAEAMEDSRSTFAKATEYKKSSFAEATEDKAGCGAVGSVLRSGRRGRKFESSHPDFWWLIIR
jgi:hypothetical protein